MSYSNDMISRLLRLFQGNLLHLRNEVEHAMLAVKYVTDQMRNQALFSTITWAND